jgi:hypothetical protein
MNRLDLDDLEEGWAQYEQSQEHEDHYGVECVLNTELDIVLNASVVLKIAGSRAQRIDSRDLSIFHFLSLV